ncbi:MAG: DEAD/DEAH box helicase, partial [Anaerolineaceae bacterium]|nr:DEAD/DEAH box helicase [Anaerolineaceae bacterium]
SFNLRPELVQAVEALGYSEPTPIQEGIIPLMMEGHDVSGQAQTGTGKTAAFALPILNNLILEGNLPQALILAPTRELALQVSEATATLGQFCDVNVLAIYGGSSYSHQLSELRRGVDIVVGTPGRRLDLINRGKLDLSHVRTVVLDEADEMLSMGFIEDIESILAATPPKRQTALFSATLPTPIRRLAEKYMHDVKPVSIQNDQMTVAATEQRYYLVNEKDKLAALTRLFEVEEISSALIFARTKIRTGDLVNELNVRGFPSEALNGDLSQDARERTLSRFRAGQVKVLVATDVAARGLDIDDISHVFNFDLPDDADVYVHRIGRTGRAGKTGIAISLARPGERRRLRDIEHFTRQQMLECTIPTIEAIQIKRQDELINKVNVWLRRPRCKEERAIVELMVASGVDPMDLAAAALKVARADEKQRAIAEISPLAEKERRPSRRSGSEYSRSRKSQGQSSRGSRSESKQSHEVGMVRLKMDVGRAQGIRPADVVGAIAFHADIPGSSIGKIFIQDKKTMVDVPEGLVGKVLSKGTKYKIRQQGFSVELADKG